MRYVLTAAIASILAFSITQNISADKALPKTLCSEDENVVFSCSIRDSDKTASLCASKDLTGTIGYMQYRFGRDASSLDLQYPETKLHPKKIFKFGNQGGSGGGTNAYSFHNGGYRYSVFDTETTVGGVSGIIINKEGKRVAFAQCDTDMPTVDLAIYIDNAGIPSAGDDIDFISGAEIMTTGLPAWARGGRAQ